MAKAKIICLFTILLTTKIFGQVKFVDSLKNWISENPAIDSQYIQTLHRISYRLSEKDVKQSFSYYERVSHLSDSLNFTFGKSLAQINLGILLYNSANFEASNNAFFKAIDYAEACNAMRLKAVSLNNIGDNFKSLKNYNKCRQYANEAIILNKQLRAWRGVAINYELLQQCDLEENMYRNAKVNLVSGMPYAILSGESYILSQYYLGFAKLHAINNETDSANLYFDKALEEARIENDTRNEYFAFLGKAKYLKNLPTSYKLELLDSALLLAGNTQYYVGISDAAEQLSLVYEEKNDKDSSLKYYRIYRTAFDSLFSSNIRRNLMINESERVIKQKEIENAHLLALSQLQKNQLIFKNALLLAFIILLILTVVIGIFIYTHNESKKKRTEFALKQKIAESQIQSLRAQMNPHFIFNSLNSIENFMMQNEKRKASDYLHKFALLIRIILESSRNELTTVPLDMEALKLYIELEQMRFNNKFQYKEVIDSQLMDGDYIVPSLLIQPYVENAIIHGIAHSDKNDLQLSITVALEKEFIKYTIEDNGIGRTQAESYKKINRLHHVSLGLKISEDRIHLFNHEENSNGQIKITDLFDSDNKFAGTRVEVKLKTV
jgi:uncharacterized protein YneF (UPF0154 family)